MVVAGHALASQIGVAALASGGNAADAAVATMAALNVLEPHASGLGGGGFALYYDAQRDSFAVIDYRERAPIRLDKAAYFQKEDTLRLVQRAGGTSVGSPGSPAGWQALHDKFGTLLLSDLLAPAIAVADTGYPVTDKRAELILEHLADLQTDPNLSRVFLDDSLPPAPGFTIKQPKLAKLLEFLARTRLTNFYYAPISTDVVHEVRAHGGMLTTEDLGRYQVEYKKPIRTFYHGYELISLPPPAGGTTLLEILKLLEPLDLPSLGYLSADYIHAVATASRQALTDADAWLCDPDFNKIPTDVLLSPAWLDTARTRLSMDTVADKLSALDSLRAFGPGNTTHLVVVDSAGNIASITQSINYFFGSGLMVPEWGLLLNNHMADFSNDSTGKRALNPLRRPPSNMAATIIRKDGRPILVIGSPGGPRIAPTLAQVIIAMLDFNIPLADALNAPRFFPARKTLVVETRIPQLTLDALSRKGWKIAPNGHLNSYFGGVHAIAIDPATGNKSGAADPRRDGQPAGY
jgi:gamma-glutamyltranspeptidase/glutathione hydrolase